MSGKSKKQLTPVFAFAGLLALGFILSNPFQQSLPIPPCPFKKITGFPCPFCGTTHSLLAFFHGEWRDAFLFNPVIFIICIGITLWFILWIFKRPDKTIASNLQGRIKKYTGFTLFIILSANWIYLIVCS